MLKAYFRVLGLVIALSCSALAVNTCTTCYIDFVNGVDTNDGTAKTTGGGHGPWKNAPGMKGCTSNCSAQTSHAGDQYILQGGITWTSGTQEWHWQLQGGSGNNIYVGVDLTWYNSTNCLAAGYPGFCRPIINAGNVAVTGTGKNRQLFLDCATCNVTVDNLEWFNMNLTADTTVGYCDGISWCFNSNSTNFIFENNYCHGWNHNASATGNESSCGNGDTGSPTGNSNSQFINNVCDGSDTTQDTGECLHGGPDIIAYNYCNFTVTCIIGESAFIHDNWVQNVISGYNGAHQNGIEINFVTNASGACYVYNNVISHVAIGLALWVAPESGTTCYVFNNVVFNQLWSPGLGASANTFDIAAALISPSGTVKAYNNTFECGPDGDATAAHWNVCVAGIDTTIAAVTLENNHWITAQTSPNNGVWSVNGSTPVTETTDLKQLPSAATAQGYIISQTYPFSPTTGGSTIGNGTNLTSLCSGTLVALCSDTTLAVAYNATTHVATSPNRIPNARPASGAWDQGAYTNTGITLPSPASGMFAYLGTGTIQ